MGWAELGSLQDELLTLIRDGRDVLDATKFLTGSGTNEPFGVLTGLTTTQRIQTNTVATYAVGDPWLLKAGLPAPFIPNVTFAANPGIWGRERIEKFEKVRAEINELSDLRSKVAARDYPSIDRTRTMKADAEEAAR